MIHSYVEDTCAPLDEFNGQAKDWKQKDLVKIIDSMTKKWSSDLFVTKSKAHDLQAKVPLACGCYGLF